MRAVLGAVAALLLAACTAAPGAVPGPSADTSAATATGRPATTASCARPCYADPASDGTLPRTVREASGIAASSSDPDLYFVVDDATGTHDLTAVRSDGTAVGTVTVEGLSAANAEALSEGACPAGRCLYVGDIGGNRGRTTVSVYRLTEPVTPLPASVPADRWDYTYPGGAFDAEAMLVTDDGGVVIVTRPVGGDAAHRVYSGPPGGGELLLRTTFRPPEPAAPEQSLLVGNVATDAARNADGVLLLTYDQALEYRAPSPGADPADFPEWPAQPVPIPAQWQSEGITYRAAGRCGVVVVSEKSPISGPAIGSVDCS